MQPGMNDVNAIMDRIERQARQARIWSLAITAVALAGAVAALWLLVGQVREKQTELAATAAQIESARSELDSVRAEIKKLEAQRAELTQLVGSLPEAARKQVVDRRIAQQPASARIIPRTEIRIASAHLRPLAADVSARLEKWGCLVTGLEIRPERGLRSEFRFFREEDRKEAEDYAGRLSQAVNREITARLFRGSPEERPRQFQLYLPD